MNRLSKWLLFPVVLLLFIAVFSLAVADVMKIRFGSYSNCNIISQETPTVFH